PNSLFFAGFVAGSRSDGSGALAVFLAGPALHDGRERGRAPRQPVPVLVGNRHNEGGEARNRRRSGAASRKQIWAVTEGKAAILFPKPNEVFYNPVQEFNRDLSIAAIRTWDKLRRREVAKHRAHASVTLLRALSDMFGPFLLTFKILEALSASGIRSVRYGKEIPNVDEIIANDVDAEAVESIKRNVARNKLEDLVVPNHGDAMYARERRGGARFRWAYGHTLTERPTRRRDIMYAHRTNDKQFDVVDLDPYGSASRFIDGAVQSVANGGLLCVTCTDLGVLAGHRHGEKW
ncbi:MAG: S-adenosyl-L-methionine-dependent methyltransferase, partial [Olpidium bornovanus]